MRSGLGPGGRRALRGSCVPPCASRAFRFEPARHAKCAGLGISCGLRSTDPGEGSTDASQRARGDHAGQAGRDHGRKRPGRHLPRTRRRVEPVRATAARARTAGGRPHRDDAGEPPPLLRTVLGRAARGAHLHRDEHPPGRRRDRLHRRRLRREDVRSPRSRMAKSAAQVLPAIAGGRASADARRHGRRLRAPASARLAEQPAQRIADERAGGDMLYSSGTTGRPKGVFVPPETDRDRRVEQR